MSAISCTCDYCGAKAEMVDGTVIYPHRPDLAKKLFWRCEPCQAYVGCHRRGMWIEAYGCSFKSDGTIPLGRLANSQLRFWKGRAHDEFDPLWHKAKGGTMTRREAYAWLSARLGVAPARCHIGMFDVEDCQLVVRVCQEVRSAR